MRIRPEIMLRRSRDSTGDRRDVFERRYRMDRVRPCLWSVSSRRSRGGLRGNDAVLDLKPGRRTDPQARGLIRPLSDPDCEAFATMRAFSFCRNTCNTCNCFVT